MPGYLVRGKNPTYIYFSTTFANALKVSADILLDVGVIKAQGEHDEAAGPREIKAHWCLAE